MLIRLCSVINCMVKLIFNEQGNNETSGWVYWVPKQTASQWEAGWRITGHLHLPPNIFLLLSKRKYILLPPPEELKSLHPRAGSLFITEHSFSWPLSEMRAPDMRPQIHLPNHQKGGRKRLASVGVIHSSHFPYLVFVIKTCLLKHTFPLPSTWKIYGYCIAFHISALNSTNTQAICLVITDDFSSNLKLSSLALTLAVSILSFYAREQLPWIVWASTQRRLL